MEPPVGSVARVAFVRSHGLARGDTSTASTLEATIVATFRFLSIEAVGSVRTVLRHLPAAELILDSGSIRFVSSANRAFQTAG
jgi:hypothetical protein